MEMEAPFDGLLAPAYEIYTVHKLGDWFVDGIDLGFVCEQVL